MTASRNSEARPGDRPPIRSLLVRCVNWIGDAVMTIPALRELRRQNPEMRITLMGRPWVLGLFEGQDFLDHRLELTSRGNDRQRRQTDCQNMRAGGFDAVLFFPNSIGPVWMARQAGIPLRMGYATDARSFWLTHAVPKGRYLRGRHHCYHYLHLLHATGLSPVPYLQETDFQPDVRLQWTSERRRQAQETARLFELSLSPEHPMIGIHAGASYGSAKRWFSERFAQTAEALGNRFQAEIILIGSEGERGLAEEIARSSSYPLRVLAGKTSLAQLLELMSLCRLFLANDSGPMHLASALDVPLLALFGSTDPSATAPLGSNSTVIKKETACSPCLLRECPQDLRCFDRISVDEVLSCSEKILGKKAGE